MFKNVKLRKALIGAGLGVLGACAVAGGTWLTIDRIVSQKQNVDTGFDADNENHDYGETVDLPKNIILKRNVAGQAATLNVRATVLPDTVVNKKLTWELVWTDGGSHGNIADYVTVTPSADTLSAVITLKAGFNNQIKLVVKSQQDNSKQANCTLDYQKRIVGVDTNKIYCGHYEQPDEHGTNAFDWYDMFEGTHSFDDLTQCCGYDYDTVFESQDLAYNEIVMFEYDSDIFNVVGTTGTPELNVMVKFEFDDNYKNAINSNNFGVDGWDSSEWQAPYNAGVSYTNLLSGACLTVGDFETNTTRFCGVDGLYGAVSGSVSISVKFSGADGFEKIVKATYSGITIPSITNVTGVQLDNSTYVF